MPVNGGCWAPLVDYLPETITPRGPLHRYTPSRTNFTWAHTLCCETTTSIAHSSVMLLSATDQWSQQSKVFTETRQDSPTHRWADKLQQRLKQRQLALPLLCGELVLEGVYSFIFVSFDTSKNITSNKTKMRLGLDL